MSKKAILLLNMGGATTRDEFRMFLMNMFRDKNILNISSDSLRSFIAQMIVWARLKKSWKHYELVGGSPLPGLTKKLVSDMSDRTDSLILPVMRYTIPRSNDTIAILRKKNIAEVVLLPLYPQYSVTTTFSSTEDFFSAGGMDFSCRLIEPYYSHRGYNELICEHILPTLGERSTNDFVLIFSAHGLPEKVIRGGDPYKNQLEEQLDILREMFHKKGILWKNIHLGYQSRLGPLKWIGPSLQDILKEQTGNNVVIFPLSFFIDNIETVYELDIELREFAYNSGVSEYVLCSCIAEHPRIAEMLLSLVDEK